MICVDGGQGLLAAPAYHGIPVQRCRAHKIRDVLDKVRKVDQDAVRQDLHAAADNRTRARSAANRFATRWEDAGPSHACATISTIC